MGRYLTVDEAAHAWVESFSRFPQDMIAKLWEMEPEAWREVTKPRICDRVYVYDLPEDCGSKADCGEITGILPEEDRYQIELDDGTEIVVDKDAFDIERDDTLPMWGWLWQFGDIADDYWLSDRDGIEEMSRCGFRVYEHDEWGYFFGIDGAGYDFYYEHWIPLYRARGLQWHEREETA